MMPTCFNVSVYQVDKEMRTDEIAVPSQNSSQDEIPMSLNASFDVTIMAGNLSYAIANDVH